MTTERSRYLAPLNVPVALGFLLFLGGCVRTTQPILLDEQVVTDADVLGDWVSEDGKNSVKVTADQDSKSYSAVVVDDGKKGAFVVRLGHVGALYVAEIRPEDPAPDANSEYKSLFLPLYTFLVIEKPAANELSVTSIDSDWVEKYLKTHPRELPAAQLPFKDSKDTVITATTEEFQAFLKKHAKDEGALGGQKPTLLLRPDSAKTKPAQ